MVASTTFTSYFAKSKARKYAAVVLGVWAGFAFMGVANAASTGTVTITCAKSDGTQRDFSVGWDNSNQYFADKGDIARLLCEGGHAGEYRIFVSTSVTDLSLRYYQGVLPQDVQVSTVDTQTPQTQETVTSVVVSETPTSVSDSSTAQTQPTETDTQTHTPTNGGQQTSTESSTPVSETSTQTSQPVETSTPSSVPDSQTSTSDSQIATLDTATSHCCVDSQTTQSLDSLTSTSESSTQTSQSETSTSQVETPLPTPVPVVEPQPVPQPEVVIPQPEPQPEPDPVVESPVVDEPSGTDEEVPLEEQPSEEQPVVEEQPPVEEPSELPVEEETHETPVEEPEIQVQPEPTPEPSPQPIVVPEQVTQPDVAYVPPVVTLDNGVILSQEVAEQVELLQNPAELLTELFTDPVAALAALGSVGADMTPEQREKSQDTVVQAVIVGSIVSQAAGAAYRRKP